MASLNKNVGKVAGGEPSKPSVFTFVPVVQKLPSKNIIAEEERSTALTGNPDKNVAVSHEETTSMSDGEIFKAEIVFIKDSVEGKAGNVIQRGTEPHMKPSPVLVSLTHTKASPSARSENTPNHVAAVTASMETAVDKHRGISQRRCHDTSGHAETHKIKSSYKSLAAIPTNTLLLDQQVIDEQVERELSPCDMPDGGAADTHMEMCSPAQLRQQSEELYAVIDEILANSTPVSSRSSTPNVGLQNNSSFPKSLGRETKYASLCSLHPSAGVERKLTDSKKLNLGIQTKPGVIRPMTAIPRLTVEEEEEFRSNPFRQFAVKQTFNDKKKVENAHPKPGGINWHTGSTGKILSEERKPQRGSPFSVYDLQITEPEEQISHLGKDALTSFSPTERHMQAFETHI